MGMQQTTQKHVSVTHSQEPSQRRGPLLTHDAVLQKLATNQLQSPRQHRITTCRSAAAGGTVAGTVFAAMPVTTAGESVRETA